MDVNPGTTQALIRRSNESTDISAVQVADPPQSCGFVHENLLWALQALVRAMSESCFRTE